MNLLLESMNLSFWNEIDMFLQKTLPYVLALSICILLDIRKKCEGVSNLCCHLLMLLFMQAMNKGKKSKPSPILSQNEM